MRSWAGLIPTDRNQEYASRTNDAYGSRRVRGSANAPRMPPAARETRTLRRLAAELGLTA
jgi:hypothetical protein